MNFNRNMIQPNFKRFFCVKIPQKFSDFCSYVDTSQNEITEVVKVVNAHIMMKVRR